MIGSMEHVAALFADGSVPADLAALWAAQDRDETDLLDAFELVLIEGLSADDALAPFADDPDSDPVALTALGRLLQQVVLIAEAIDGLLLGYWSPPGATIPVVVAVDGAGQVVVQGRTFAEALLTLTDVDDPEEGEEVIAALSDLGVRCAARSAQDAIDHVASIADPNELVLGFMLEARLRAGL